MINQVKTNRPPKVDDPLIVLPFLLKQTSDIILNAIELELAQHKINIPQVRILFTLTREKKPISLLELSKLTARELNSTSIIVNKMEKDGLVSKINKPGNRKTYVSLTEKGADLYNNRITENAQYMIFGVLSEGERKDFENCLKKLLRKARNSLGMDFKPPFLP